MKFNSTDSTFFLQAFKRPKQIYKILTLRVNPHILLNFIIFTSTANDLSFLFYKNVEKKLISSKRYSPVHIF